MAEIILDDDDENHQRKRYRSSWVSGWLQKRSICGVCDKLLPELRVGGKIERQLYTEFHRLNEDDFNYLHELVAPIIRKQDTNMREAISTKIRLELTLHFLATGNSYRSLRYYFRLPQCTISKIIPENGIIILRGRQKLHRSPPAPSNGWLCRLTRFFLF